MQGSVYQLVLTDHDGGAPHPHVVLITFSGNRDCIVIPAYSTDGFMINQYIEQARRSGLSDNQIFVKLDNAQSIDFTAHFSGKEAYWCIARHRRLSQTTLAQGVRIGQMKPQSMREIASSLLSYAEIRSQALSPNAIKSLRHLVKSLDENSPVP